MRSAQAELLVRLPHLVVADRLPAEVVVAGTTVALTGQVGAVRVVGALDAHVAGLRWRAGRRTGGGRYEVVRGGTDRTLLTVVLDGASASAAVEVCSAVRTLLLAAQPAAEATRDVEVADGRLGAMPA